MTNYKKYVIAVNKIFEIVDKMKLSWTDQDNLNYLKKIEDYKDIVIETSKKISQDEKDQQVEELGK